MTTRRRSTLAAVLIALAVAVAPTLTPAALAYDAKASGPDASARLVLPDWDRLDGGIDPFDRSSLIPRRAMEHPRDGLSDWLWWGAAGACLYFGCSPAASTILWVGAGISMLPRSEDDDRCTDGNDPIADSYGMSNGLC